MQSILDINPAEVSNLLAITRADIIFNYITTTTIDRTRAAQYLCWLQDVDFPTEKLQTVCQYWSRVSYFYPNLLYLISQRHIRLQNGDLPISAECNGDKHQTPNLSEINTRGSYYSVSGYISFAQRATFGRGRAGSDYALAALRDNFVKKFF